ncbi:DSD1 family PLP-dependent enzyme [Marinobacter sp. SS21]|uniref:DSD1 family PLP-dependent enzyme n=1 Tax=Marinobacter sp. SS21 TaxID=2979460 RepID=UPI002330135F|nr:DSD1 family PLP-dependent enzyme [Marinobacter sp. SS21]MDC0661047.1 DSD1 family PLP-dependent enzyme [Marinobacter sp. SS21]
MSHSEAFHRSRRRFLLGSAALGLAGASAWLRPGAAGGHHSDYFQALSTAAAAHNQYRPLMIVDEQRLLANLDTLTDRLAGQYHYRIVAKSLPSVELLQLLMARAGTERLMVFHQPFLTQVAHHIPQADVLLGKPMPVQAARQFYQEFFASGDPRFQPARQLQWLVDSPHRLAQYRQLAEELGQSLRINLEIDIGLHRGGVQDRDQLVQMLRLIEQSPWLSFSGFMGYEAHITQAPGRAEWLRDQAMARYRAFVVQAEQTLGRSIRDLTLNTGGSTTYPLYRDQHRRFVPNELAVGSALVKPTDFDLPTLSDHRPAAFIATPVLKVTDRLAIPGVPGLGQLMAWWNPNRAKALFIYGGHWPATPVSPAGLSTNPLYGRSSNQEMLNGSVGLTLQPDDWVFLRPSQSEQVLLQFNGLARYDAEQRRITGHWSVLG